MIDLRQAKLKQWQDLNFPRERYQAMDKEELIDMILLLQFALGMSEEVGEVSHAILKGCQRIREGQGGIDKDLVIDGVTDTLVFGVQALSQLGVEDAEAGISKTIDEVLQRDWLANPGGLAK